MIINVRSGEDLVTVDLSVKQVRFVRGEKIEFFDLSSDDVAGYTYLYNANKDLFLKSLVEDVESNLGVKLKKKDLKFVKLQ